MNALVDLIPAKGRKWLYGVLAFGLAVYSIYLAVHGDWVQFTVSLSSSLVSTLATANTNVPAPAALPAAPVEAPQAPGAVPPVG